MDPTPPDRSATTELHDLAAFGRARVDEIAPDPHSLPRPDGGKDAWLFLTACFMVEALVWGFPTSFGVFQAYYGAHAPFAREGAGIAAIGTTATGTMYLAAPAAALAFQRWPRGRRPAMGAGLACMVLALVAASFCDSVDGLLATQGVLYALGGLVVYFPTVHYIDEWFIARKGFAYGIMWAGTGSAGIAVPFLLQWLLDAHGYRTALRVWAVVLATLMAPALFFVKGRLPVTASNTLRPSDLSFLKRPPFWVFQLGNVAESFGYFLPTLWLPTFARTLGFPTYAGTLGLALYNLAGVGGALLTGALVDRFHVSTAILISTVGQVIAIFLLWGLTTTPTMLYVFAIVWGVFGGGFSATWAGCAGGIRRLERTGNVDTGFVISLLAAGRGVGAVISGPLSTQLLQVGWKGHADFAYGSGFGILIVFSGISTMLGGLAWVGRMMKIV